MEGQVYKHLRVVHNHGQLLLRDAVVVPYEVNEVNVCGIKTGRKRTTYEVKGIVEGGGETSRLFHATNTTKYKVGEEKTYPIYGRTIYKEHGTEDHYYVDCCFCG